MRAFSVFLFSSLGGGGGGGTSLEGSFVGQAMLSLRLLCSVVLGDFLESLGCKGT